MQSIIPELYISCPGADYGTTPPGAPVARAAKPKPAGTNATGKAWEVAADE